jgi:hypothetical protein
LQWKVNPRSGNLSLPPVLQRFFIYESPSAIYFWKTQERPGDQPMMSEQNPTPQKSLFKNPLVYSSAAILIVALYVGWVLLSRQREDRVYEHRAEEAQAKKQREADQAAIEQLGGSELAIQMIYATPRIARGETAQICFGVANAKSVTLEPQSSPVWPSHSLCVDVKPIKTTTYKLTATGADGKSVSQVVKVEVR